jgi:hypothetical protein
MNTEKLEKLKKSLDNKFIPDNMKDKIRVEIQKLESEIKTDDTITATEVKEEVKEIEKKVEKALEVADKKEEQAKAPAKTRAKRTSKTETKKPKSNKKSVFSVAKEIRKAGESWDDARKRASKMMKSENTETKTKVRTETSKLLASIRRKKELKNLSGTNIKSDINRTALPKGRRVSKKGWKNQYGESEGGRVYYENRDNRTDRLAPSYKDKIYLADGGGLTKYVKIYFVQGNYGSGFEDLTAHDTFLEAKKERKVYDENERNYPHRVIERRVLRTDFEKGNYANGGSLTLTPETPLARGLGISYTGLVGETGAMSSGEMFAGGGQITISEIKRRTSETSPYFFDAKTMKFFNQKMSDFKVRKLENGKYEIYAPIKDSNGKSMGVTKRIFNPETNKLEFTKDFADGGSLVDGYLTDPNFGDFQAGVYADGGSTGLPAGTEQHFVNYYLGEGTAQGIFAEGGGIENQYIGKTPNEIWGMYSTSQKYHFLLDHSKEIESTPMSIEKATKTAYRFLPEKIKKSFQKHIREGQYAKGGEIVKGQEVGLKFDSEYHKDKLDVFVVEEIKNGNYHLRGKKNGNTYSVPKERIIVYNYAKGGGVRMVGGREYPTGRAWTNEHRQIDKADSREVNYTRKKSFNDGGAMENIEYDDVLEVLKEKLEGAIDDLPMDYENSDSFTGEEVEKQSRDGFIAFTDGGYEVNWFEYISMFTGSGKSLPTKPLDTEMDRQVAYNYQYAKERFIEEYPEIVEELGEDNIDYNSLYDADYGDEAEQLSEWEMDFDGDDTILCEIGAYYYDTDNSRGIDEKNTLRLFGYVNLESPYHRRGNLDDSYDIDITFDSISELKEKVDAGLKEIIDWFDGKYYNDSTTEMKIRRMADGGEFMTDPTFGNFQNQVFAKGGGVSPFKNMMETNTITEKEINLIKLRMNNDKVDNFTQEAIDFIWDNSPQLTSDQNKKGIDYLRNLWKSPTGKERTNNPFGYREQDALETFEYFELRGFYDAGNRYRKFYVPLYTCVGAETSFEYYISGGGINIVG